jgi:hypothetical protein
MNYDRGAAGFGRNRQNRVPFRRNPDAYGGRFIFFDA